MTDLKPLDLGIKWYSWIVDSILFIGIVFVVSMGFAFLSSEEPSMDRFIYTLVLALVFKVFYQRQKEYETYERTAGLLTRITNMFSNKI